MKRIQHIWLLACLLLQAVFCSAQSGNSCADALLLTSDYTEAISGACVKWYRARTFDLPLTVSFRPTDPNAPVPDVEMDFTCTPGVYEDPYLHQLFSPDNGGAQIVMPFRPTLNSRITDEGDKEYYITMGEIYRDLLLQIGISYNVDAFVKVTFHSAGNMGINPDDFGSCMDNTWIDCDQSYAIPANKPDSNFITPFIKWQTDSICYIWEGTTPVYVGIGDNCEFTPDDITDIHTVGRYVIQPGDTLFFSNADINDFVQSHTGQAGVFFSRFYTTVPGTLRVEHKPVTGPAGNVTVLAYDQPAAISANNTERVYAISTAWNSDTRFFTPTNHVFKMYVGTTPHFTIEDAIRVYQFSPIDDGHELCLTSSALQTLLNQAEEPFIYARFECTAATTVTPELWSASSCIQQSTIILPGDVVTASSSSTTPTYAIRYSDWNGGDMTFTWNGTNSTCALYIAETCTFTLSATNKQVVAYSNIQKNSSKTFTAAQVATWANRVDADGFLYIRMKASSSSSTMLIESGREPEQDPEGEAVCRIGTTEYATLEDAILFANNHPDSALTIVLLRSYTLPTGQYTLPAKAKLLIPYQAAQDSLTGTLGINVTTYTTPTLFCRLTLDDNAQLNVYGTVEVSAQRYTLGTGATGISIPTGPYANLQMNAGSSMVLNNNAKLIAWGFVTGAGTIDARSGSNTYEDFQIYDWKGGTASMAMVNNRERYHTFIVNQYYIQNIESPVTYHPGSRAHAVLGITAYGEISVTTSVMIIGVDGESAMFLMNPADNSENTWVRKSYDAVNDRQMYEVNSSVHLGSLTISALGNTFNSADYILPITNNMQIRLLSGYLGITQSTALLPGATIEVDKTATVSIENGKPLYLYDSEDWGRFAYNNSYANRVRFSPSWAGSTCPRPVATPADLGAATLNIHGTFTVDGAVYTSTHGARIISTNEDAGTFTLTNTAPTAPDTIWQVVGSGTYTATPVTSAMLRNAEGQSIAFATTAGYPAGTSFGFQNNRWSMMTIDEDDDCFSHDNYNQYYIKPSEYIAIQSNVDGPIENADHTYSDAANTGRFFIRTWGTNGECWWWEVVPTNNLYYCAQNQKYYTYDEDSGGWIEKQFSIYWRNYDGTPLVTDILGDEQPYLLTYGTTPEYLDEIPTRPASVDYTYDFSGWTPALAPVTADVIYTATYTSTARKYTIIFQDEDGSEIERQFLTLNEIPVCANEPTKEEAGHTYHLTWQPAIAAVTGDQTYRAVFVEDLPTEFTITFNNYDGSELCSQVWNVGETPSCNATPTKPATDEFTYEFDHWNPAVEAVAGPATYTAVFREVSKTFAVRFFDEKGNQLGETQYVAYGSTPEVPNYTKPATQQYTYTTTWTPQVSAVTAACDYTAVIEQTVNRYTVTVVGTGCTFTGAGTYDYGTSVDLTATAKSGYENPVWADGETANPRTIIVTCDTTFTANATPEVAGILQVAAGTSTVITSDVIYTDLILEANANESADLVGAEHIHLTGNAYFDLTLNADANRWYAIAVPWEVNADNGILPNGNPLVLGTDIDILYYDGQVRAQQGKVNACWRFVAKEQDHLLHPGRAYMIRLRSAKSLLRFVKTPGSDIAFSSILRVQSYTSGINTDAGWNGIANPETYKAYMDAGIVYGQIYHPYTEKYSQINMHDYQFRVGEPVFVQAAASSSVTITTGTPSPVAARSVMSDQPMVVRLSGNDGDTDEVWICTTEDKDDAYVIGQDLMKAGLSTRTAQLWIARYDSPLCIHTATEADMQSMPLGIFVPATGTYTFGIVADNDKQVLLMQNDVPVWDFRNGNCTRSLGAGTDTSYAIRIQDAPAVTTDMQSTNETIEAEKIIVNGMLYILRDGAVFNALGKKVQ